jgi:hypothetical protein
VKRRRDERAGALADGQARWERDVAASGGRFEPLHPTSASSSEGAELTIGADGGVRASGAMPAADSYAIEATPDLEAGGGATAIRIEALVDPSLPNGGPGRAAGNGNFVLNELRAVVTPSSRQPRKARFVRIVRPGKQKVLSLAEVEVISGGENVARRGTATQSSVDYDGRPERAIDGVTDGRYFEARSTTHNRVEDDPWWEVDLGAELPIDRVVVWNRVDGNLQFRLAGASVTLLRQSRELAWQTLLVTAPDPSAELDPAGAFAVGFARASADFEQERFGVAAAIDGDESSSSGWAISPATGRPHVAVFETTAPIVAPRGSTLRLVLRQGYGSQHVLGALRLSLARGANPPAALPEAVAAALSKPADARSAAERDLVASHYRSIAPELLPFNAELAPLEAGLASLDREVVRTPILRELPPEKRRVTHLLVKSNWLVPGDVVEPATPAAFPPLPDGAPRDRLGVAQWLVSPENPLTARVTANRFWAQLFGRGIVETEEDFGTQGVPPTHPELLDWLALRFVASGWDVKELLFTIVTSATYRQESRADAAALAADPRDLWLARYPRRRLEAEMVRDQALAIAGLLSSKMHGPSVFPPQPDGLWQVAFNGERDYPTSGGEDRWRRSLYTFWRRTVPPPAMQTFDAPSREYCTIRRQESNTPLQALVTLNDPVFVEAAQALARRIVSEGGSTPEQRAAFALERALVRPARAEEISALVRLHGSERRRLAGEDGGGDVAAARALAEQPLGPLSPGLDPFELAAWTIVANVVLNLDVVLTRS